MTLSQALAAALAQGLDRLDAQLLMLHALGRAGTDRAWLLAHDRDEISHADQSRYRQFCERRGRGEPLAYIVGRKEFFGLDLKVDPRVLVPRPETETLVEWALDVIGPRKGLSLADLGTGSGAIALSIKKHRPDVIVQGFDTSPDALVVAAANAKALSLDVSFQCSSWLTGMTARYDLIVSNPPYIAQSDPHLAGLVHEPINALSAGCDGLDDIRAIVAGAPDHLQPGGWLLLEHGWDQAAAVRGLLAAAGLVQVSSRCDLAGIERCSGGQRLELG